LQKILIVDDRPEVRELLEVTLNVYDYRLLFAENSSEAIELARSENPDIILLDIMMPNSEFDGLEVCRRLKQDPATASIMVIMVTARGQQSDVEAGKAVGADDYFFKPFSPISLINKIEDLIERKYN